MPSLPAILFETDGYDTRRPHLMGRQVAGAEFLRALARSQDEPELVAHAGDRASFEAFERIVREANPRARARLIPFAASPTLAREGCLFVPGPGIGRRAISRMGAGWRSYSLCGVTHTISSDRALDALVELASLPVAPWDAVVCTSRAVRDTVRRLMEANAEYLAWRLGAARPWLPQFPLIPLGVNVAEHAIAAPERAEARAALGLGDESIVFLFLGRLSFHAKAHPLPMFQALARAQAQAQAGRIRLVLCGWYANDWIRDSFRAAARALCPSVGLIELDGRDTTQRRRAWAAADVFTSLADNIQESFGLTPIEAMAAGLPSVVSDWDGYRDTVRDGIDGMLVPTLLPPAGSGADIADLYAAGALSYDRYSHAASQAAAVDVGAAAQAFAKLAGDGALRRRMGEAARRRAVEVYDWPRVLAQYAALWRELAERRRADALPAPGPVPARFPARLDPLDLFAGYATRTLGDDDEVALAEGAGTASLGPLAALAVNGAAEHPVAAPAELARILADLERDGPRRAATLWIDAGADRQALLRRAVVWLAKLGLVAITPARG